VAYRCAMFNAFSLNGLPQQGAGVVGPGPFIPNNNSNPSVQSVVSMRDGTPSPEVGPAFLDPSRVVVLGAQAPVAMRDETPSPEFGPASVNPALSQNNGAGASVPMRTTPSPELATAAKVEKAKESRKRKTASWSEGEAPEDSQKKRAKNAPRENPGAGAPSAQTVPASALSTHITRQETIAPVPRRVVKRSSDVFRFSQEDIVLSRFNITSQRIELFNEHKDQLVASLGRIAALMAECGSSIDNDPVFREYLKAQLTKIAYWVFELRFALHELLPTRIPKPEKVTDGIAIEGQTPIAILKALYAKAQQAMVAVPAEWEIFLQSWDHDRVTYHSLRGNATEITGKRLNDLFYAFGKTQQKLNAFEEALSACKARPGTPSLEVQSLSMYG